MNRNEFENALMSTIVEYISDQIVLRYMDACKKAVSSFLRSPDRVCRCGTFPSGAEKRWLEADSRYVQRLPAKC